VALVIAFPAGIFSAIRPRSWIDQGSTTFALLGISLPSFWLGIMLILLFSLELRWLPPSGYLSVTADPFGALRTSLLPAVTLGVALAAPLTRFLRSGMLDVLGLDYVRTARAKGLTEQRVGSPRAEERCCPSSPSGPPARHSSAGASSSSRSWLAGSAASLAAIQRRDYGVVRGSCSSWRPSCADQLRRGPAVPPRPRIRYRAGG
jgi:hypothetical protein